LTHRNKANNHRETLLLDDNKYLAVGVCYRILLICQKKHPVVFLPTLIDTHIHASHLVWFFVVFGFDMSFDPQKVLREQQEAQRSSSWILTKIHEFNTAHNRLKHYVHTAWRYPLPPWGRAIMGCVYFSIPVFVGYGISSWIVAQSEASAEERLAAGGVGKCIYATRCIRTNWKIRKNVCEEWQMSLNACISLIFIANLGNFI